MSETYTVYSIFTPTTQAKVNFVPRKAVNDQLVDALRTPGKQLIVYGESGSGKSTLLLKKLEETCEGHITTRCSSTMTFEQLLLDGFDQLNHFYVDEATSARSKSVSASIAADFSRIRASIDTARSESESTVAKRMIPPQLTAQRLGQFLGAQGLCWVVEDFHKMHADEKRPLAQSLKVFSDLAVDFPEVKVIAIGATDTAREVVEYDREMAHRVSELPIPLMNEEELSQILANGEHLLNVAFTALADDIVGYSVGLASVCHQLALNVCLEGDVPATQGSRVVFNRDDLKPAVERYVRESSDTLKATFDRALRRHKVRKYDNCRLILSALAGGPLEGMLHSEVLDRIRQLHKEYPAGNLTLYLQQLIGEDRGSIIRRGLDGKYRFVDPIHHTFAQATLAPPTRKPKPEEAQGLFYYEFANVLLSEGWTVAAPGWTAKGTLSGWKGSTVSIAETEPFAKEDTDADEDAEARDR